MLAQGRLISGIIVLNAKYFPSSQNSAAKVGATSFAFSVIEVLQDYDAFRGVILYERVEDINFPVITPEIRNSIPCVRLSFNFGMAISMVQNQLSAAAKILSGYQDGSGSSMLYYQTDTLLVYHPKWLPGCVTHHGPFYKDFTKYFSPELAAKAFQGFEKAQHLKLQQELNIDHLVHSNNIFVLQHSQLQRNYLIQRGVDPSRLRSLSPPISVKKHTNHTRSNIHKPSLLSLFSDPCRTLIFTAVARIDFFKNVDLIIESGVEMLQKGLLVNILIVGGDIHDEQLRLQLLDAVPRAYLPYFMTIPKLPKNELYTLLGDARDNGIFVCSSRFETLGITPLEAAIKGVTTLITDSPLVEASNYFPATYRFGTTSSDLAETVERILTTGPSVSEKGEYLKRVMGKTISGDVFRKNLVKAWSEISLMVEGERGLGLGLGMGVEEYV
ncbi:putative glycosyl transferase protein [Botrytis fragariae]|uniref:Putative glycosyl transferase protein n=1 Tax=Botrytis fragariae TaxID=1964551 RepID=A0A8H6B3Y3_9HELO|nr:putative glycosyl transferase protein [Botrytis fragariae]KAF5878934.1 putative glycosyl transferase protein [Botrytis fragariae]